MRGQGGKELEELRQMFGGVGCDKKRTSWWIGILIFEDIKTDSLRHKDKKNIFSTWFSEDIKTKRTDLRLLFFYNKTEGMN